MVIAITVLWVVGILCLLVAAFAFTIEETPHEEEPFKRLFDSWGGVRFYTLWAITLFLIILVWPLALLILWITALIKGW